MDEMVAQCLWTCACIHTLCPLWPIQLYNKKVHFELTLLDSSPPNLQIWPRFMIQRRKEKRNAGDYYCSECLTFCIFKNSGKKLILGKQIQFLRLNIKPFFKGSFEVNKVMPRDCFRYHRRKVFSKRQEKFKWFSIFLGNSEEKEKMTNLWFGTSAMIKLVCVLYLNFSF